MRQAPDLREESWLGNFLKILHRRWWIVAAVVVVAFALAGLWLWYATPIYQAEASILRQTTNFDQALFQVRVFQDADPQRALQTGSDLITSDPVARLAQQTLQTSRSARELARLVDVTPSMATDLITINASSPDPADAAAVANAFASAFISYRQSANRAVIEQARKKIEASLAGMTAADKASASGAVLIQKSEELQVLESMETGGYEIVQQAEAPLSPVSPRPVRTGIVALVVGLIGGVLAASATQLLNKRIRDEDGLEAVSSVPVLASIPLARRSSRSSSNAGRYVGFSAGRSGDFEPYRGLRSNLKYFAVERRLRSVVITSSLPQEGKSVTCVNLGLSLALSGSRVLLVEADLRRPRLHQYLGLSNDKGLSDLLLGEATISDVVQQVPLERLVPVEGGAAAGLGPLPELRCITSGPLPPNPAELLDSQLMRDALRQVVADVDYVLIDTPPVLVVSDALSFVSGVDGVLVVSRLDSTREHELRRTMQHLRRSGAHVMGMVAGGGKGRHRAAGKYSSEYYTSSRPLPWMERTS